MIECRSGLSGMGAPALVAADKKVDIPGIGDRQRLHQAVSIVLPGCPVILPGRINPRQRIALLVINPEIPVGGKCGIRPRWTLPCAGLFPVIHPEGHLSFGDRRRIPVKYLAGFPVKIHDVDPLRPAAQGVALRHIVIDGPAVRIPGCRVGELQHAHAAHELTQAE